MKKDIYRGNEKLVNNQMSAQISNSSKSLPHMKTSKQKPQPRNNTTCTIMEKSASKINHSTTGCMCVP